MNKGLQVETTQFHVDIVVGRIFEPSVLQNCNYVSVRSLCAKDTDYFDFIVDVLLGTVIEWSDKLSCEYLKSTPLLMNKNLICILVEYLNALLEI